MGEWASMASDLHTERLHLGPWQQVDLDDYEALVHERDPRTAAASRDRSREALLTSLVGQQASIVKTGIGLLTVRMADAFAGYCGLVEGHASLDKPEIAFELLVAYQGRGIATEAASAMVQAPKATGRGRLWATVRSWNEPSFRVLHKVGFERTERTTRDTFGETVWCTRRL